MAVQSDRHIVNLALIGFMGTGKTCLLYTSLIKDRSISAGGGATTTANGDIFLLEVTYKTNVVEVTGVTTIQTGVWYHVAAMRGTNFLRLYVNGKLDAQMPVNQPQDYGNLPLYFASSGQAYWDCKLAGSLDEVSLYNRVLSSNEVAAIYQAGSAGKCKTATNVRLAVYTGPCLLYTSLKLRAPGNPVSFSICGIHP